MEFEIQFNYNIPHRLSRDTAVQIANALMREPMNLTSLGIALGINPRYASNYYSKYIDAFKKDGVIYIHHYTNVNSPWYMWQPGKPFGIMDAQRPDKKIRNRGGKGAAAPRLLYKYNGMMMSLSDIAKKVGLNKKTLYSRLTSKNLSLEEALSFPARVYVKVNTGEMK